jgi:hypothetical protein
MFAELFAEFGERAGIADLGPRGLTERLPDRVLTGLVRLLGRAGLPQASMLDTSPYDRAMKRLHDTRKDDEAFQADEQRCATFELPPFHSWVVAHRHREPRRGPRSARARVHVDRSPRRLRCA